MPGTMYDLMRGMNWAFNPFRGGPSLESVGAGPPEMYTDPSSGTQMYQYPGEPGYTAYTPEQTPMVGPPPQYPNSPTAPPQPLNIPQMEPPQPPVDPTIGGAMGGVGGVAGNLMQHYPELLREQAGFVGNMAGSVGGMIPEPGGPWGGDLSSVLDFLPDSGGPWGWGGEAQGEPVNPPIDFAPRAGEVPPMRPDVVVPPTPPMMAGGGPEVPQQLPIHSPQLGMAGSIEQGPAPDLTEGMLQPEPPPPPVNPQIQAMLDYQDQTNRMIEEQKKADRVSMWMGMAQSFLEANGDLTKGMSGAANVFGNRQQQKPQYEAIRSERDDNYLDRLEKLANVGRLERMGGPSQSAADRKLDMGMSYVDALMEENPEKGIQAFEKIIGLSGGGEMQIEGVGIYHKGTGMIDPFGGQPVHISDPSVRTRLDEWIANREGVKAVAPYLKAQRSYADVEKALGPELASVFGKRGVAPDAVVEEVLRLLSDARSITPTTVDMFRESPELLDGLLSNPDVRRKLMELLEEEGK